MSWVLFQELSYVAQHCPADLWEQANEAYLNQQASWGGGFLRYSPADGTTEMPHVPTDHPQEQPVCQTQMAIWYNEHSLVAAIYSHTPTDPIPELASMVEEDFSWVLPYPGGMHGIYLGMNQSGDSIAMHQMWDAALVGEEQLDGKPAVGKVLSEGYAAKVVPMHDGLVGLFNIDRQMLGLEDAAEMQMTLGRRCYATGELVSWGSPVMWSPRPDRHGTVLFDVPVHAKGWPRLKDVVLEVHDDDDRGKLQVSWDIPEGANLTELANPPYQQFVENVAVTLNGVEHGNSIRKGVVLEAELRDGWNCVEVMDSFAPVKRISFQVSSPVRLVVSAGVGSAMPPMSEIEESFAAWHTQHETVYRGDGVWSEGEKDQYRLCHDGAFHLEPYLVAMGVLPEVPEVRARTEEACTRMLREQRDEGWFPCYHFPGAEPTATDGGAFTNGSVGEVLAMAGQLWSRPEWIASSRRAASYAWYKYEINQNYAAFTLWHLAALRDVAPCSDYLERALYFGQHFATRDIGPSGAQDGHNYFTAYGNITLKGMARLHQILPANHAWRSRLTALIRRFANQILSRQQTDGLFAGRNRKYIGYWHLVPGLFFVADALADGRSLEPALAAMTRAAIANVQDGSSSHDVGLTLALAARFVTNGPENV